MEGFDEIESEERAEKNTSKLDVSRDASWSGTQQQESLQYDYIVKDVRNYGTFGWSGGADGSQLITKSQCHDEGSVLSRRELRPSLLVSEQRGISRSRWGRAIPEGSATKQM
jgi:hypothetical protein